MIDRSKARENPKVPVALEAAAVMGTGAADTILASAHLRARQKAGHMRALSNQWGSAFPIWLAPDADPGHSHYVHYLTPLRSAEVQRLLL